MVGLLLLCCGGLSGITAIGAAVGTPEPERPVGAAAENVGAADNPDDAAAGAAPATAAVPSPPAPTTAAASPAAASPSATSTAAPVVRKRTVRETRSISYKTRTVRDSALSEGTKKVRVQGAPGVRTLTYEITETDGVQTGKRLISSTVTRKPVTKVIAVGTRSEGNCDPNYSGPCVPIDSDVDCAGGSGNGPSYVNGVVKVTGSDIYDLDRDGDGYGCD